MSYLTQMVGLGVQNFVSAAAGMAVLVALIRGFERHSADTIGNFWVDLTRSTLYILMPLALVYSLLLVSQGVVQTFSEYKTVSLTQTITYDTPKLDAQGNPVKDEKGNPVTEKAEMKEQVIPLGPGCFADRDQAARHERRRVLQCQFGPSFRKPDRFLQFS